MRTLPWNFSIATKEKGQFHCVPHGHASQTAVGKDRAKTSLGAKRRELEGLDLMNSSAILEQSHMSMPRLWFGAVSRAGFMDVPPVHPHRAPSLEGPWAWFNTLLLLS